jgi:hypothetical protein
MPTYRIPWKLFDYHPKGRREREVFHRRDRRIHSTNPETGTGQKFQTLQLMMMNTVASNAEITKI